MNCIFCQIVRGNLDAAVFWENDDFIAALDIFPNVHGMSLVISKQHYESDLSDMSDEIYGRFFAAARQICSVLKRGLLIRRVAMVLEGMGINHAHIKLYPLHGLANTFQEMWAQEQVFFEKYTGYITTQLGPNADIADLKILSEKLLHISKTDKPRRN
jgi:histidine triad (HIT) family protein